MEGKSESDTLLADWHVDSPLASSLGDLPPGPKRRRRSCCYRCCCSKTFCLVGFILSLSLGLAIYFTPYVENAINVVVIGQLPLKEGSPRADMWAAGVPPLIYRMYVFNLTNPGDFRRGARPIVEEVGPIAYDVTETRENIVYNGSVISFQAKPIFTFRPDLSVPGGEDLMVNTLNIPLINAGDMAKSKPKSVAFYIFREVFAFESIRKLTVRELLWGHNSRLLNVAKTLTDLPYPHDYFALLAGRNNTLQPLTSMNTGVEDISMMSQVLSYDGPGPKTGCNSVFGTDGSGFGPNVNESRVLFIYNGQFCRSLPLVHSESFETDGLRTMRFVLPDDVFTYSDVSVSRDGKGRRPPAFGNSRYRSYRTRQLAREASRLPASSNANDGVAKSYGFRRHNATRNQNSQNPIVQPGKSAVVSGSEPQSPPNDELNQSQLEFEAEEPSWQSYYGGDNKCFCRDGKCLPDGVLDMKPCLLGAPVGFSFPHFLNADPRLRHIVRGLRPDPTLHSTEFDIFPDLGVPLRVKLRMQMNVVLDRNQALNRARHFDMIYPIFWFEAGIDSLPVNLVGKLQMAQDLPPLMKQVFVVLCGVLSVIFLVLLMAQTFISWCSSGLSSIRGRGSRGSSNETITTAPETEIQGRASLNPDVEFPDSGAYKSFASPQLISNDRPHKLIDNHTLLPPYKNLGNPSVVDRGTASVVDVSERTPVGTNSDSGAGGPLHEPDESQNEYPPEYHVVASTNPVDRSSSTRSNSSVVSAEVEFHRSGSYLDLIPSVTCSRNTPTAPPQQCNIPTQFPNPTSNMFSPAYPVSSSSETAAAEPVTSTPDPSSHPVRGLNLKPLPIVPRIVEEESLRKSLPLPSAPLASPEYDEVAIEDHLPVVTMGVSGGVTLREDPLATSSPHNTMENINPSRRSELQHPRTPAPRTINSNDVSRISANSSPESYYIAPPLESDL